MQWKEGNLGLPKLAQTLAQGDIAMNKEKEEEEEEEEHFKSIKGEVCKGKLSLNSECDSWSSTKFKK